jgi:hypothetical protein
LTLVLAVVFVREQRQENVPAQGFRAALGELSATARTPTVILAAGFLFLWSFNPFNTSVLYLHMTKRLSISEQDYGISVSMLSVGAIAGSLAYGFYCRRVPMTWLIHLAIATGILSTLAYAGVSGPKSLWVVSTLVGFTYLTGSIVQFDLAARACPVHAAGTTFALLMSISNLSLSLSMALGSSLYVDWTKRWGASTAFQGLVVLGSLSTAFCWLLYPYIKSMARTEPLP